MTLRSVLSRRGPSAALSALVALALVGCATTGERGAASGGDAGPTLTLATSFAIDDLDPLTNGFWGPEFGYVELLMRPERDGSTTPWVLSDLKNEDETTWRLTLNEGVRFTNGRTFDADALARLLQWTAQENDGFAAASSFASAEVTGDLEVTVRTTTPVPALPSVLADESQLLVLDVEAYEDHRGSGADPQALLEAGSTRAPTSWRPWTTSWRTWHPSPITGPVSRL